MNEIIDKINNYLNYLMTCIRIPDVIQDEMFFTYVKNDIMNRYIDTKDFGEFQYDDKLEQILYNSFDDYLDYTEKFNFIDIKQKTNKMDSIEHNKRLFLFLTKSMQKDEELNNTLKTNINELDFIDTYRLNHYISKIDPIFSESGDLTLLEFIKLKTISYSTYTDIFLSFIITDENNPVGYFSLYKEPDEQNIIQDLLIFPFSEDRYNNEVFKNDVRSLLIDIVNKNNEVNFYVNKKDHRLIDIYNIIIDELSAHNGYIININKDYNINFMHYCIENIGE